MRPIVVPALAMCIAIALPAEAQSVPSAPSEADSAAVLSLAVDELLKADSASYAIKPDAWKDPEAHIAGHPRFFVRIGNMPFGAWAKPSIARLRAWHWRFNGWVIDSTQAQRELAALPERFYAATLGLRIIFEGDMATVEETWAPFTCELGPPGLRPVDITGRLLVRSSSGWRYDEGQGVALVTDGECSGGGLHAGGASSPR